MHDVNIRVSALKVGRERGVCACLHLLRTPLSLTRQPLRVRVCASHNAAHACVCLYCKAESNTHTHKHTQKKLEDLEDAGNELMLADDETVRYVAGECFVYMDKEAAEERLEKLSASVTSDLEGHKANIAATQAKMKELKAQLYGKFGNSINL